MKYIMVIFNICIVNTFFAQNVTISGRAEFKYVRVDSLGSNIYWPYSERLYLNEQQSFQILIKCSDLYTNFSIICPDQSDSIIFSEKSLKKKGTKCIDELKEFRLKRKGLIYEEHYSDFIYIHDDLDTLLISFLIEGNGYIVQPGFCNKFYLNNYQCPSGRREKRLPMILINRVENTKRVDKKYLRNFRFKKYSGASFIEGDCDWAVPKDTWT